MSKSNNYRIITFYFTTLATEMRNFVRSLESLFDIIWHMNPDQLMKIR